MKSEARFRTPFQKRPIAAAISALAVPATLVFVAPYAVAAPTDTVETITVTATRREEVVQDVPINISAVSGNDIEQQGIASLAQLSQWVPGLYIVNQGSRGTGRIVARGLNADPLNAAEALGNDGGRMVATYLGEIPIYIDLKLNDMERVEVLLGPQGTLYGAGTMSGAIRYIPIKPLDRTEIKVRGNGFGYSESDGAGADGGITVNLPIADTLAFRGTYDYLDDPGFIDYDYTVREPGVSNPSVLTDANIKKHADANDEKTQSGRAALRWAPVEAVDATLTYYFQFMDSGGRNTNSKDAMSTGDYTSAARVFEPNDRDNQLVSLEVTADLGFAELVSATGGSRYEENGHRDQTDLLITLEYSYELFPNFTAYTTEHEKDDTFTQEIRLVSASTGKWSWIVGGFYQDTDTKASSKEFTPGYPEFLGIVRPDNLEYYSVEKDDLKESAVFGEVGYQLTEAWQITVGARWYEYKLDTESAFDTPLFNTFLGAPSDEVVLNFEPAGQNDSGDLYKFNTSYQFTNDLLAYLTVSEGYRIGNSNGIAACPDPIPPGQTICALPDELAYFPDETTNYEIGAHSTWLDGRLTVNGDVFYLDWDKPQVQSATENGLVPIKKNGSSAESYGMEMSFNWLVTDRLGIRGSYSYVKAELTDDVPGLVGTFDPPPGCFGVGPRPINGCFQNTIIYLPGESGDRLPGSPENQGSLFVSYTIPIQGYELELDYGATGISDVLTRVGEKGFGESLDGYVIQDIGATLSRDQWTLTLYAMNVFNEYAETSATATTAYIQSAVDENGDPVPVRSYKHDVLPPRMVGLRFTWEMSR